MSDFIIRVKRNRVQANRVIDGELEPILFAGELAIPQESFWDFFKKKIEYLYGEKLALVIISDDTDFQIDAEISIADSFINSQENISWLAEGLTFENAAVTSYPVIDITAKCSIPIVSSVVSDNELEDNEECNELSADVSLQAFYRKKTRDYGSR